MKATLNPTLLSKELKKMALVINRNNIIPISGSVLFTFTKNKLKLTGTDLETTYITELECKTNDEFSFAIDYFDVSDIFNSVSDDATLERKNNDISIKSGKAKFNLGITGELNVFPVMPTDDYFFDTDVTGDFFYHLTAANSRRSREVDKVNYNMAAIRFFKTYFDVCGCDGFTMYKKKFVQKNKKEFTVMVPDKFVTLCKAFQETKLHFGEKYVMAETGTDVIISRLSENKYVNVDAIIPSEIDYNIEFNTSELKKALTVVSVAAMDKSKQCVFNFNDGIVKITAQDIDYNKQADVDIDVSHKVEIPAICFNSQHIIQLLSLIDDDSVEIAFSGENKSVYLKPLSDDSILILAQPLMLSK